MESRAWGIKTITLLVNQTCSPNSLQWEKTKILQELKQSITMAKYKIKPVEIRFTN